MAKKDNKIKSEKVKIKKNEKNKRHFLKDFKAELKKVVWPTPKQLVNSTVAVITIVLVIGIIVFVLDMGFELLNKQGINRLQVKLQDTYNTTDTNTTSGQNSTDDASSTVSSEENSTTVTAE